MMSKLRTRSSSIEWMGLTRQTSMVMANTSQQSNHSITTTILSPSTKYSILSSLLPWVMELLVVQEDQRRQLETFWCEEFWDWVSRKQSTTTRSQVLRQRRCSRSAYWIKLGLAKSASKTHTVYLEDGERVIGYRSEQYRCLSLRFLTDHRASSLT